MEEEGGGGLTLMGQGGMANETFCLATGIVIEQFDPHLHADAHQATGPLSISSRQAGSARPSRRGGKSRRGGRCEHGAGCLEREEVIDLEVEHQLRARREVLLQRVLCHHRQLDSQPRGEEDGLDRGGWWGGRQGGGRCM